jgi:AraC-like DNA-binding protein
VENRQVITLEHMELNIFETHQYAEQVPLTFPDLVVTSMLRGKKIMHLFDQPGFDYLPGESVIVPPGQTMVIDFPEANPQQPSQCLALAISDDKIKELTNFLNENFPKSEQNDSWTLKLTEFHLRNTREMTENINKLMRVIGENNSAKELFASFTLNELLIRFMQSQARRLFIDQCHRHAHSHRLAFVVAYIREHIDSALPVELLAEKACMSKPHFFRCFKQELGLSPTEFILQERIRKAKNYLRNSSLSITQISLMCGFNQLNYFNRIFRIAEGMSPGAWRQKNSGTLQA